MSIMGYSNDDKSYTYREFNSWGEFDDSKGSLKAIPGLGRVTRRWARDKRRFTMKVTSPTSYDFTFEMSQDGTKWSTFMDGKATKK